MTVILNKPALSELAHYGVKGMKWGVRKERDSSSRKPGYSVDKDGVRAAKTFVKMQENTTVKSVEEYAKEASKSHA